MSEFVFAAKQVYHKERDQYHARVVTLVELCSPSLRSGTFRARYYR